MAVCRMLRELTLGTTQVEAVQQREAALQARCWVDMVEGGNGVCASCERSDDWQAEQELMVEREKELLAKLEMAHVQAQDAMCKVWHAAAMDGVLC